MRDAATVGYGLIGAGAFGQFCLDQYHALDSVKPVAVADVDADAARAVADKFGLAACASADELFARDDVQIVHIATPPTTHVELALQALDAGKHVLCEKPLATTLPDAQKMVDRARATKRVLAANLIMRYDPLCEPVKRIVERELLGQPLHAFFENDAKDEPLPPDHWFWKREHSGGIFIEHGVHFFDLFAWWLAPAPGSCGNVEAAQQVVRPDSNNTIEQVQCAVRYDETVLVNFYHGFTQAQRMDRQEMRLVFERGEVRLFEWVPTSLEIDCLADNSTLAALRDLLPQARVETCETYTGDARRVYSRHKHYEVDGRYRLRAHVGMDKPALYGHVLRALLADQVAAIRDPAHERRITEANGFDSLKLAAHADTLARRAP